MNVTRDVVNDLLTVYLAGEASADTRSLVEEWLRRESRSRPSGGPEREPSACRPSRRPRRRPKSARSTAPAACGVSEAVVLGAAIYFATLPLSVTFNSEGFLGLLLHDGTSRTLALLVAVALVGTYVVLSRRLR